MFLAALLFFVIIRLKISAAPHRQTDADVKTFFFSERFGTLTGQKLENKTFSVNFKCHGHM